MKKTYVVSAKFTVNVPVKGEMLVEARSPEEARGLAIRAKNDPSLWHGIDPDMQYARILAWFGIASVREVPYPERNPRNPDERKRS